MVHNEEINEDAPEARFLMDVPDLLPTRIHCATLSSDCQHPSTILVAVRGCRSTQRGRVELLETTVLMTGFGGEASADTRIAWRNKETRSEGKTANGGEREGRGARAEDFEQDAQFSLTWIVDESID